MVTIKEIARECKVSTATVSNILNGKENKVSKETKQRVEKTIRRLGYRPNYMAKSLRTQKTGLVYIIAEDISQFTTPPIVDGIMGYCEERGYRILVKNLRMYARWGDTWYNDTEVQDSVRNPAIQEISPLMADGVIYIAGHARKIHCFPENFPLPAVMTHAYAGNPDVPSVLMDDEGAAYEIVSYLIAKGHRKIGVIGGKEDNIHTQKRLLGYQRALYENGLLYNPSWVRFALWDRESAYHVAGELLKTGITAVFCMADRMAGGVYQYLDEQGMRAGRDFSVAGFDNQDIAEYFVPGLTTMVQPLKEMGRISAELLIEKMEHPEEAAKPHREILVPCAFLERQSVCVCPQA